MAYSHGYHRSQVDIGDRPYSKEVDEDSKTGQLHLRYQFERNGDQHTYERTLNVKGKTDREKQQIIEGIEKELGIKPSKK